MKVVLVSTYDLGRQPFGLASPAAWLRGVTSARVRCLDLTTQTLDEDAIGAADLVGFFLPMHTATRIAARVIPRVHILNPTAHICAYGLYAPMNEAFLRKLGVGTILGGEFEDGLVKLAHDIASNRKGSESAVLGKTTVSLAKQDFLVPDRAQLPPLNRYAYLTFPDGARRTVGNTEASRGCKHLCRHCPIVPVYNGRFRIVNRDVVLGDIRQQVESGAEHITFGDPDFFNGIRHAMELVQAVHHAYPNLTYDVTIKVEHLIQYQHHLPALRDTGCAFITTAVESVDDEMLKILDKGHTRADFFKVVEISRDLDLPIVPTFVAFHPWLTLEGYQDLLATLALLDLIQQIPPVQLTIRLLIPEGSRLLELPEVRTIVGSFDEASLSYRWQHPDPRVDCLQREVESAVKTLSARGADRRSIFLELWKFVHGFVGLPSVPLPSPAHSGLGKVAPNLSEAWYCCAEHTDEQLKPF